ncbi:MAG TPA: 1,2-phenylacetyl-CoA epoxidase subunit PaaC [Verrucomicrobiae bacterium]|jgi:ring-1,2-phenylacetyl-CoA epoxidase subunit PaaC
MVTNEQMRPALFEYLLCLGDDMLVLGHRLSEWCGHAPIIEEDIALANIALDCIGQGAALLRLAGHVEGKGRTDDALVYFRDPMDFKNAELVEQPNGDFGFTIARQFLFDAFSYHLYEALSKSGHTELAAIATKAFKEISYHLRHSSEWTRRLGDGTAESHARIQNAFDELWPLTDELFAADESETVLVGAGVAANRESLKPAWDGTVNEVLKSATLARPQEDGVKLHTRNGGPVRRHSEHLGRMLAEMQSLARAYPEAEW